MTDLFAKITRMPVICILILFFCKCFAAEPRQIAITIDDVPRPDGLVFTGNERANRIIKILDSLKVTQVAFFCVAGAIDINNNERILKYSEAGHIIANHSYSHFWASKTNTMEYLDDIRKADRVLSDIPGFRKWFRYPYLDRGNTLGKLDSMKLALKDMGYFNAYVTVDTYDWYLESLFQKALESRKKIDYDKLKKLYIEHLVRSAAFYDEMADSVLGRSPRHTILLHENDLLAMFLGDLITRLREEGWEIISPEEAYIDPLVQYDPRTVHSGNGRIEAIARYQGYKGTLWDYSKMIEFLDKYIEKVKVFY